MIFIQTIGNTIMITLRQILEDMLPGGQGDDMPDSDFDENQLKIGIKHEMEHTNNPKIAKEIAKDHLSEDPDYYKKLSKVEKS